MSVLDQSIVAEVRETLGDDIYRGFVERMLAEAAEVGRILRELHEKGDAVELAKVSHRMAGSAVSVGAQALHARLKAIEDAARMGALGDVPAMLAALEDDLSRTKAALDDILR